MLKNNESLVATQRAFRQHFNIHRNDSVPARNTIKLWIKNFGQTACATKKKLEGRPRSVRTPENVEQVRRAVVNSPQRSTRKLASALGITDRTVRRILHQDLHFHPYKLVTVQQVNVWCGVASFGVIGPYFFEDEQSRAVTTNAHCYNMMLRNFIEPELRQRNDEYHNLWFQQYGATVHTANISMATLRGLFPGRVISRRGDVEWSPRSPDLNVCDFFLWGYLKSKVYENRPRTAADLKQNIRNEVAAIPGVLLQRVMRNFRERLQECVDNNGQHLKDTLFKK
ncbi:hypothetical protein C0J52_06461 [Blattella germanica]|nr:hypothetical protein C0J52_06461 [Blattella germanica]